MNHYLPRLTTAISTTANRVSQLWPDELPVFDLHEYLIILQIPETGYQVDQSRFLERDDIQIETQLGGGLSRSRNLAIQKCRSKLIRFCDDDIDLKGVDCKEILDTIADFDDAIFVGRLVNMSGKFRKKYSPHGTRLNWFNIGRVGSPEIIADTHKLNENRLRFDEEFGLGARYPLGEEMVFLSDAFRRKLTARAVNVVLGKHDDCSSGQNFDFESNRARANVFSRSFGLWGGLLRLGFWMKHHRKFLKWEHALMFVTRRFGNE